MKCTGKIKVENVDKRPRHTAARTADIKKRFPGASWQNIYLKMKF